MNVVGKKIYLRAMELEDMELFREMTNDPSMERKIVGWSFPVSKMQQMKWYESSVSNKSGIRLSIVHKDNDKLLGMLNLVNIDWKNGTAYHGIRLSNHTPKKEGLGTDAVMTLMKYAFEELRLHRLEGGWIADNIASKRLYQKCGWKAEGLSREAVFCEGKYYDFISAGILENDYYEIKKKLGY